jgi:hypothetical protein
LRVAIPALLHPEARRNPRGVAAVEKRGVGVSEVPEQPPGTSGGGTGAGVAGNHQARATHAVPAHRLTKCSGIGQGVPARTGRSAELAVEIHEMRPWNVTHSEIGGPRRSAQLPPDIQDDWRIVRRKSCREFVTIEQQRYHSVRIPQ